MKNFTKAALIIAVVLVILGCSFCAVGLGIGFSFPEFWEEVEEGNFSIGPLAGIPFIHRDGSAAEATVIEDMQDLEETAEQYAEDYCKEYETDHGIAEAEETTDTAILQEGVGYEGDMAFESQRFLSEDVTEIEVEAYRGSISIVGNDDGSEDICVETSYRKDGHARGITMYIDGKALKVEEEAKSGEHAYHNEDTQITIKIPRNVMESVWLEKLELKQESGSIYIDTPLTAQQIDIIVKKGECIASGKLTAMKKLNVELNAGNGTFADLETKRLNLTAGAGEITADTISASEKINMKCGMGTLFANVAGKETDYSFDITCGVGAVSVGDNSLSGIAGKKKIENPGSKKVDVECGMGTVDISFTD